MSRLNRVSFIDLNELDRVLWIDSIGFILRLKRINTNQPLLILSNYLYSDVLTFNPTWKMVKDTSNYVSMKMIGLAQTSRKIIEDGDVPILLVVLITPYPLQPGV